MIDSIVQTPGGSYSTDYQFPRERTLSQRLSTVGLPKSTANFLASSLAGQRLSRQDARRYVNRLTADRKENFLQRRIFLALREASNYHETSKLSFPDEIELSHRLSHVNRNRLNHLDKKLYAVVIEHFANMENISEDKLHDHIGWLVITDRAHLHRRCCLALNKSISSPKRSVTLWQPHPLKTEPLQVQIRSSLEDSSLQKISPVVA